MSEPRYYYSLSTNGHIPQSLHNNPYFHHPGNHFCDLPIHGFLSSPTSQTRRRHQQQSYCRDYSTETSSYGPETAQELEHHRGTQRQCCVDENAAAVNRSLKSLSNKLQKADILYGKAWRDFDIAIQGVKTFASHQSLAELWLQNMQYREAGTMTLKERFKQMAVKLYDELQKAEQVVMYNEDRMAAKIKALRHDLEAQSSKNTWQAYKNLHLDICDLKDIILRRYKDIVELEAIDESSNADVKDTTPESGVRKNPVDEIEPTISDTADVEVAPTSNRW